MAPAIWLSCSFVAFFAMILARLHKGALDFTPLVHLRRPVNALTWVIRSTLRWSRGLPVLKHESKTAVWRGRPVLERRTCRARERQLTLVYPLERLYANSTCDRYRENLYVLDTLDRALASVQFPGASSSSKRAPIRALDIGSKDWTYVAAQYAFLTRRAEGRPVELGGIELDGHGTYSDLFTRADYARAHVKQIDVSTVHYMVGDFLEKSRMPAYRDQDIVFLFYPFLTQFAELAWGLPARFFSPREMLSKAAAVIKNGGTLVVLTHTEEERHILSRLARTIPELRLLLSRPIESRLADYWSDVPERYVHVFGKGRAASASPPPISHRRLTQARARDLESDRPEVLEQAHAVAMRRK